MTKEELESLIKEKIPDNSLVLLSIPESRLQDLGDSLNEVNKQIFKMGYKILLLACPDDIRITVIPAGAETKIEDAAEPIPKDS